MHFKILCSLLTAGCMLLCFSVQALADEIQGPEGESFTFTPKGVTLGDYHTFSYVWDEEVLTDEEIEEEMQQYFHENAEEPEYEAYGTVEWGDQIILDYTGSVNGTKLNFLSGEDEMTTVGSGDFPRAFEEALAGAEIGKERQFSMMLEDGYFAEDKEGEMAEFSVLVKERAAPEENALSDTWVAEHTAYGTVEEWKEALKGKLSAENTDAARSAAISSLLLDLTEASTVLLAESDIDAYQVMLTEAYEKEAAQERISFEEYALYFLGMDGDIALSIREEARESLEREAVLQAFIEAEKIDIGESAYADFLDRERELYQYATVDEMLRDLEEAGYDKTIRMFFHEEQAGERLMDLAKRRDISDAMVQQ